MDVLTDVMKTVRLTSSCWGKFELTAPWGMRYREGVETSMFHYILRGGGWVEVGEPAGAPIPLSAGDLVVVSLDRPVTFRDDPSSPVVPVESLFHHHLPELNGECPSRHPVRRHPESASHGGGGRPTTIISGVFHFEERATNPLLTSLPAVMHIRNEDGHAPAGIATTLRMIAHEATDHRPGTEAAIDHLSDLLFIQTVRAFISGSNCEVSDEECRSVGGNWLRALADPPIARVLGLIHAHPERDWTVASLAEAVSMSRSAFATKFTSVVGEPPLAYLTRWRLIRAARMMRESGRMLSLAEIAAEAGYESEAAFNKAFKRMFGQPPGAFRRGLAQPAHTDA